MIESADVGGSGFDVRGVVVVDDRADVAGLGGDADAAEAELDDGALDSLPSLIVVPLTLAANGADGVVAPVELLEDVVLAFKRSSRLIQISHSRL